MPGFSSFFMNIIEEVNVCKAPMSESLLAAFVLVLVLNIFTFRSSSFYFSHLKNENNTPFRDML